MNSFSFTHRRAMDFINQKILGTLRESPEFDVDLVAANGKTVGAHRVILSMYSQYFRKYLALSAPDEKFIVPLPAFSCLVLEKVVELFYCGEIRVLNAHTTQVKNALDFLEVSSLFVPPIKPKPVTKLSDVSLKPMPDYTPSEILPASQQKPDSKQPNHDALRQQNSEPVSSKDPAPTKDGTDNEVKSNSATETVIQDENGLSKPKQQQQQNEVSSNASISGETKDSSASSGENNSKSDIVEKIGINLLYDDIGDGVDDLRELANDLMDGIESDDNGNELKGEDDKNEFN